MSPPSAVIVWRDALRDSRLNSTAKLVGLVLSTHMTAGGDGAYPSQDTLARETSLEKRAIYRATRRLEEAGFIAVTWSRGRASHRYRATLPTATESRRSPLLQQRPSAAVNTDSEAANSDPVVPVNSDLGSHEGVPIRKNRSNIRDEQQEEEEETSTWGGVKLDEYLARLRELGEGVLREMPE